MKLALSLFIFAVYFGCNFSAATVVYPWYATYYFSNNQCSDNSTLNFFAFDSDGYGFCNQTCRSVSGSNYYYQNECLYSYENSWPHGLTGSYIGIALYAENTTVCTGTPRYVGYYKLNNCLQIGQLSSYSIQKNGNSVSMGVYGSTDCSGPANTTTISGNNINGKTCNSYSLLSEGSTSVFSAQLYNSDGSVYSAASLSTMFHLHAPLALAIASILFILF